MPRSQIARLLLRAALLLSTVPMLALAQDGGGFSGGGVGGAGGTSGGGAGAAAPGAATAPAAQVPVPTIPLTPTPVITNQPGAMPAAPYGGSLPGQAVPTNPSAAQRGIAGRGGAAAPGTGTPGTSATPPGQAQPGAANPTPERANDSQADETEAKKKKLQQFVDLNERNEFRDFVAQSTGKVLPLFGYSLFRDVPSTFAPVDQIPVTPDYVVGPGDQIVVRAWGQIDIDYTATVDRNGQINIPKVGVLSVAGLKFQELHGFLKTAIGRWFHDFQLNVTMGDLRSIQIFVVGQAARPGAYTVSSLSTLMNAIFASGGPSQKGSMRRVQLRRGSATVVEFDMYDLLINGDKSKDVPLLPGDVIYYPPIGPLAAISGSVNNQAIFELKDRETLGGLLRLAGGFTTTAQAQRALVDRIADRKVRRVEEFALDAAGLAQPVRDGDVVNIASITPRFDNAVRLQGNVAAPALYPWKEGMHVADLLVDQNALITTDYWSRQNLGTLYGSYNRREVNFDFATVQRLDRKGLVTRLFAFNLGKAIQGDQRENVPLQPGDVVTVYAYDDPLPKTENDVTLQGAVLGLPPRQFPWREGMRIKDLIPSAKWLADYYDYWLRVGKVGSRSEISWDYANVARLRPSDLTRSMISFNLGKAVIEGKDEDNLPLQPGDIVSVFSKSEIQVSQTQQSILVRLEGEFKQPGVYQAKGGETLRQLVERAGGLTPGAYLFGAEFTRESTRVQQERNYQEALNRLETEAEAQASTAAQNVVSPEAAQTLPTQLAARRAIIARLRQLKPTGRIALKIPEQATLADLPDMPLEDGDRLYVPPQPSMVNIFGAVFSDVSLLYEPNRSAYDYIADAGGVTSRADKSQIFVLRANGRVVGTRSWLFGLFTTLPISNMMPGDTIVVPEEYDRTTFTRALKDWTQILYQFGLGAAAIKILRQ